MSVSGTFWNILCHSPSDAVHILVLVHVAVRHPCSMAKLLIYRTQEVRVMQGVDSEIDGVLKLVRGVVD